MEGVVPKIQEFNVEELARLEGIGGDFLVELGLPNTALEGAEGVLIRNGIVILLCRSEGATIAIDGKEYRLSGHNVVILPENHHVERLSAAALEVCSCIAVSVDYVLNMPSPIDTNIFSYSRYISVLRISREKFDDLMSYYRFLHKESLEESRYKGEIIRSIFYALILEIIAEYERTFSIDASRNIRADDLSDKFFRLLAINYRAHRSVRFYASELGLTPKYLSTAIKRTTGRPILDWIHEAILIDAKMLLRTTDLTVQQIADLLNFSSSSAFVQFIKKSTGTTPRRLR